MAAVATGSALAASPVGVWKGKIQFKAPNLPATMNPQQKAMVQQQLAMVQKMQIVLNIKANKTFTASVSGGPAGANQKQQNGTWTQNGNNLVMTDAKSKTAQTFALSANGKTLSFDMPGGQGKIVFTR